MVVFKILGKPLIMRKNSWLSGKLASLVRKGLAHVHKEFVIYEPPVHFGNPEYLWEHYPWMKDIHENFAELRRRYRDMESWLSMGVAELRGKTYVPEDVARERLSKIAEYERKVKTSPRMLKFRKPRFYIPPKFRKVTVTPPTPAGKTPPPPP